MISESFASKISATSSGRKQPISLNLPVEANYYVKSFKLSLPRHREYNTASEQTLLYLRFANE
jgi:hypothetical protein